MRYFLLVPLVFALSSCATWEGRSQGDLIKHFGIPTQKMDTKDGEIYQYTHCDSDTVSIPIGNGMSVNSGSGCEKKLFLIKNNLVVKNIGTIHQ